MERIDMRYTRLQRIGNYFASKCSHLSAVYLPDSVTEVGSFFLCHDEHIVEIDLRHTGLVRVGDYFASECSNLSAIHLPDSVTDVGNNFPYEAVPHEVVLWH